MSAAERSREEREAVMRQRGLSIRVGTLGTILFFAGALGTVLMPESVVLLLVVMVLGLVLIVGALFLIREFAGTGLRVRELTKIL